MSQQKKKKRKTSKSTLTFSLGTKVEVDGGISVGIANCGGGAASRLHSEGVAVRRAHEYTRGPGECLGFKRLDLAFYVLIVCEKGVNLPKTLAGRYTPMNTLHRRLRVIKCLRTHLSAEP